MKRSLKILVGCEESQTIANAFRELGHEAYSCDLLPCSGGHEKYHIQADVLEVIKLKACDLAIFHPECTYLTVTANKWLKDQPERKSGTLVGEARRQARVEAADFFMKLMNADIPHIAVENPIGVMITLYRKPDQIIQPWMFGHGETKATCLWLKNLPLLTPTDVVEGRQQRLYALPPSKDRSKLRSKTFPGIAKAMAEQYSEYILNL